MLSKTTTILSSTTSSSRAPNAKSYHGFRRTVATLIAVGICLDFGSGLSTLTISNGRYNGGGSSLKTTNPTILGATTSSASSDPSTDDKTKKQQKKTTNDYSSLPLPPRRNPGPFRKVRDFIDYMRNPEEFVASRAKELGPVFRTNLFFKPAVVVGGPEAVQEFITSKETTHKVIHAALPDTFMELHTEWGSLQLDSTALMHQQARDLFADVLGPKARQTYAPFVEEQLDAYMANLVERVQQNPTTIIYLPKELKELNLQIYARIFSGQGLTPRQVQLFQDYNAGLLALSKQTKTWKKANAALEELLQEMERRFPLMGAPDNPGSFYYQQVSNRTGFYENPQRIYTSMLLFIWGAYAESAALMTNSLLLLNQHPSAVSRIVQEINHNNSKTTSSSSYVQGVVRESLRLIPQVGGGFRFSDQDFELAGYRIPAQTTVTLDPRIGNKDPRLYPEPESFAPERWISTKNKSDKKDTDASVASSTKNTPNQKKCPFLPGSAVGLGPTAWFPGGTGAHGCPGIGLAELVATQFVQKICATFEEWQIVEGTDRKGNVIFEEIPVKIPSDALGVRFQRKQP
jgi:cytochrome P450